MHLDAAAEGALRELLAEGQSANTVASYGAALRYWSAWFKLRFGRPIEVPVPATAVIQFVLDHMPLQGADGQRFELPASIDGALVRAKCKARTGPLSLATIAHRLSVLAKLHTLLGAPNPCQEPSVRDLMAQTRRASAKCGAVSHAKPALTREPLEALLATCDDSLAGVRDRALLLFAWAAGGLRRCEVIAATLENVEANADGTFTYRLGRSKNNAAGEQRPQDAKPVAGRAARALSMWLKTSGVTQGAIFRRVRKGTTVAEPLTPRAVRSIVKRRCELAGLAGDYSAHSLRSGFLTEAGRRNVPLAEAIALSGHASLLTAIRYYQAGSAFTERAARLLDEPDATETGTSN